VSTKTSRQLALAMAAGVAIGVAGAVAVQAQQSKKPPGYVIAEVEVNDLATLQKYGDKAPRIVASFNGSYVVRGGQVHALEGAPPKGYVVVIRFDSVEKAQEWYDSPEYAAIRPFRQKATNSRLFIVEGEP
jgi:uncharacterized protein (DUF1330 family)